MEFCVDFDRKYSIMADLKENLISTKRFGRVIIDKTSKNLKYSLLLVFKDLRKRKEEKKIILFSPSAASFDQFNNFEERGKKFAYLVNNLN